MNLEERIIKTNAVKRTVNKRFPNEGKKNQEGDWMHNMLRSVTTREPRLVGQTGDNKSHENGNAIKSREEDDKKQTPNNKRLTLSNKRTVVKMTMERFTN